MRNYKIIFRRFSKGRRSVEEIKLAAANRKEARNLAGYLEDLNPLHKILAVWKV